jgi:hypothetical protein
MLDEMPLIRWHAITYYRTENGTLDVHRDLEEIADLHSLIEGGPHWDTIEKIEVLRVNHCTAPDLTIEQSEQM